MPNLCFKCGKICTCAEPLNAAMAREELERLAEQLVVDGKLAPENLATLKRDVLVLPNFLLPVVFLSFEDPEKLQLIERAVAEAAGIPVAEP